MKQSLVDPAGINGYFQVLPGSLNESVQSERGYPVVKGVLQRKNALNQNRRKYPDGILDREVKKYQQLIKERRALGELDHPDNTVISLANVSHNIIECHWEGDDLVGTVEILPTPSGNILKELFNAGIKLGISSRGLGSVKEIRESDGPAVEVQDDFELVCFDFVSNPSTHGAFLAPVSEGKTLTESKQIIKENKYNRINEIISDIICDINGVCCCILEGKTKGANHK